MELEALAIFKCITRLKSYLLGRSIIIYTDNCPLCNMMNKKISNKRVEKISLLFQEFNIQQIIHVQGKYNCLPDYLSRNPVPDDDLLLDYDYGLAFRQSTTTSPTQLLGAVVTRSKSKAISSSTTTSSSSSSTTSPSPTSLLSPSSSSSTTAAPSPSSHKHFDITQIREKQRVDPQIQQIINQLPLCPNLSFAFQGGILYKLLSTPRAKTKRKLIYLPTAMIQSLIHAYHDNPLIGGHFGIRRTLAKLRHQFWWPRMSDSVITYIKSCLPCQAYNISRSKRPGFLHPVPVSDGPNQLLGIDFCGPFPTTPSDNRYVLCLTDYFTKFVTAVALPTCSASATADALFSNYICIHGVPKAIVTDQGPSFKNNLLSSLSILLGYHHILCTPYHPQSNGQTERFNATFVVQLAKLTDRQYNNWDSYLHPVVFAYNTGIHSTTSISPFKLTFGRDPNPPTDPPPSSFTIPHSHDYYQQLVRSLQYYHALVKQNITKQQQQTKIRYDHRRSNPKYALGTTVLTRIFTNNSKLSPRFSTIPKVVVDQHHPVYYVQDIQTQIISRVHVNDIRPLLTSTHSSSS